MSVGTILWRAAIGTSYSCQPCFVNNSKWDILCLFNINLLAMIFLIESVLFFHSLWIIFNFYIVIFILHLVIYILLKWHRLNCEKIYDHILICLFFWWLFKMLIISMFIKILIRDMDPGMKVC